MLKIPHEFYSLLPQLKKKLLNKDHNNFSVQTWLKKSDGSYKHVQPQFYPANKKPEDADFVNHFYLHPEIGQFKDLGSMALRGPGKGKAKWNVIDCDDKDQTEIGLTKIIPWYKKHGIDYFIAWSGDDQNRMHLWSFWDDVEVQDLNHLTLQMLEEIGETRKSIDGAYPAFSPNGIIRLDGGYHLKKKKRYPVEDSSENLYYDSIDIVKTFINCRSLSQDELTKLLRPLNTEKFKPTEKKRGTFYYRNLNLPLPILEIPSNLKKVFRNCQAINGALTDIVKEGGLETPGEPTHYRGLFFHGISEFIDRKFKTKDGENFINHLVTNYRFRDPTSHRWDTAKNSKETDILFPTCNTWNEKLDKCKGCPFQGRIHSPKQFIYGKEIKRLAVAEVKLRTTDQIRNTTFKRISDRIHYIVSNERSNPYICRNFLLASPQGAGKSRWVDQITIELAKKNKSIIIAVPTAELAMEHKAAIEAGGIKPFVLMSHENIFGHQSSPPKKVSLADYDCPSFDEIQADHSLGVSSGAYKKEFCSECPLLDKCHYPNQYTQVQEMKYKVVIIQHAHFSCQEVIYELMKKEFDIMFVDESFIKNCYASVRVNPVEIELLENFDMKWTNRLANWLDGESKSRGKLNPSEGDLKAVQDVFNAAGMSWTIPEYIRYYNQARNVCKETGIEVVYELPDVPIKVFTDATPPIELIKGLTGIQNIDVYGDDEILDIKEIHPDNEIIQIYDKSCSVTSMLKDERLYEILADIGYLVQNKFVNGEKTLLTVYKKHKPLVEEYFGSHPEYKDVLSRITIDWINKGTNAYAEYDYQFILAGITYLGKSYLEDVYKYKTVMNYYKLKNQEKEITNVFPDSPTTGTGVEIEEEPVKRIELLNKKGIVFKYENFKTYRPLDKLHYLVYNFNVANTQQSIRLRFKPDKKRVVVVFNNFYLPSTLITKSILEEELINSFDDIVSKD